MVVMDRICPEEGRFTTIQYLIQKAKRRYRQGRLPNPGNRRVFELFSRNVHLFNVRRQFQILTNRNRRPNQGQDDILFALRSVQIF